MSFELFAFGSFGKRLRGSIDSALYSQIRDSREILSMQLGTEQRFDILVENYIDYEASLGRALVFHTVRQGKIFAEDDDTHSEIERHLIGFMSAARGYRAQILQYKPRAIRQQMADAFRQMESQSAEFRVVEELRNYSQHVSLLANGLSLPANWVGDAPPFKKRRHSLAPSLEIARVAAGTRKQDVLSDLATMSSDGKSVALTPLVRKYLEDIAFVHMSIRNVMTGDFEQAKTTVMKAREIGIALGAHTEGEMMVYELGKDGETISEQYLGLRTIKAVEALRGKNRVPLPNFGLVEFYT